MNRLEVTANTAGCQSETFRNHGALRALECGEVKPVGANRSFRVDVRVAATNRNLLAESLQGRFRKDLYYRLCVMPMMVPPLRDRRGDIGLLAEHFVRLFEPGER